MKTPQSKKIRTVTVKLSSHGLRKLSATIAEEDMLAVGDSLTFEFNNATLKFIVGSSADSSLKAISYGNKNS